MGRLPRWSSGISTPLRFLALPSLRASSSSASSRQVAALLCGIKVRWAASVALLMVLNFHFASDVLFHYSYLTNAYGPPVVGGLLALAIGGTRLPFTLSK